MDKKQKTISYHRVDYLIEDKNTINFGMCVKQACFNVKTANDRVVERAGGSMIRMAHYEADGSGFLVHLAVDTPGESASVVPKVADHVDEIQIKSISPPNDAEFMDGDAFLYINKNNICLCTTGIKSGAAVYFFKEFFKKSKINKHASSFNFIDVADISKIALIQTRGVKEIQLNAALYSASFDYIKRKNQTFSLVGAVSKQFKALLSKETDAIDDAVQLKLTLKVDGRAKTGKKIGKKRLETLAANMIENQNDDDIYTIITSDNQRITSDEITLKKSVEIDTIGKSISRSEAYNALKAFYIEMEGQGLLEV